MTSPVPSPPEPPETIRFDGEDAACSWQRVIPHPDTIPHRAPEPLAMRAGETRTCRAMSRLSPRATSVISQFSGVSVGPLQGLIDVGVGVRGGYEKALELTWVEIESVSLHASLPSVEEV